MRSADHLCITSPQPVLPFIPSTGVHARSTRFSMADSDWSEFTTLRARRLPEDAAVVHVELARPAKRNAMSSTFFHELDLLLSQLEADSGARCIVLSAQGPAFSAGLDLAELAPREAGADPARTALASRARILYLQRVFSRLERCPQPVLALAHGACVGGAVDLLCCADVAGARRTPTSW